MSCVSGSKESNRKKPLRNWWAEDPFGISNIYVMWSSRVTGGGIPKRTGRGEGGSRGGRSPWEEGTPWLPCNPFLTDLTLNLSHPFMLHMITEFFISDPGLLSPCHHRSLQDRLYILLILTFKLFTLGSEWQFQFSPYFPYQNPRPQDFISCCLPLHISSFHFCTLELASYSIKKQITIQDTESD